MRVNGRYELHEVIGSGGMGVVYRGVDTHTGALVAVKHLKPEAVAGDPQLVERFMREGEALRQLNHPNIVRALDAAAEDGQHYLILEYISGGSLRERLESGPLTVEQAIGLALDLADALTRAHRLNIIHRDLKPANVLIAEDGTPRLTDFGVARLGAKARVTSSNALIGTLDYLAPEALNDGDIDARADIWAFGVMLYEMLTGTRPFSRPSAAQTLSAILFESPPDLEMLRADAPTALVDLIGRMLEKDRDARIPSVRLVGAELEALMQGRGHLAPRESNFASPVPSRPGIAHNLPAQTTSFVGREPELAELRRLLNDPEARLVTILAPGGMGKTRLALEAARDAVERSSATDAALNGSFNGAYFVSLAPLTSADQIVSAAAGALDLQFAPGGDPRQQLLSFLSGKRLLLVMDNFEHLLAGASLVSDMLEAAPGLKVLATSRERLNLSGETLFNLGGLDLPEGKTAAEALEYSAVRLFVQGARRARPAFELRDADVPPVARICRLVAGMPLGLLMATSWMEMLTPAEIASEIEKSLDFLEANTRDLPERQRSLRAVFEYSWTLLTETERTVFAKLSVFRGGFTREAAEVVAGANLRILMALVNKSLLRRDAASGRYEVHELLRQYAAERLEDAQEVAFATQAHSTYFAEFMRERFPRLRDWRQNEAKAEIEADMDNVRIAWAYMVTHQNVEGIRKIVDSLAQILDWQAQPREAFNYFETAVQALQELEDESAHLEIAHLIAYQASALVYLGEGNKVMELVNRAISIAKDLSNYVYLSIAYESLAFTSGLSGTAKEAIRPLKIFAQTENVKNDEIVYQRILFWLGFLYKMTGDFVACRSASEKAFAIFIERGDRFGAATTAANLLWDVALHDGEYQKAQGYLQNALEYFQEMKLSISIARTHGELGVLARHQQDYRSANYHFQQKAKISYENGRIPELLAAMAELINLKVLFKQYIEACELCGYVLRQKLLYPLVQSSLETSIEHLKTELPPDAYTAAIGRGEQLTQDEVVALALKYIEVPTE